MNLLSLNEYKFLLLLDEDDFYGLSAYNYFQCSFESGEIPIF